MISQQGTDASGNITYDYRKFGTEEFTPNLMLDFKRGDCDLVGSIKRGMVIYDSETTPIFSITPKSNIYVVNNAKAQNYIVLSFSPGLRSYGLVAEVESALFPILQVVCSYSRGNHMVL